MDRNPLDLRHAHSITGTAHLWHHIQNIMHNARTKLEIKVALDTLLCDILGLCLGMASLKLAS